MQVRRAASSAASHQSACSSPEGGTLRTRIPAQLVTAAIEGLKRREVRCGAV